VGGLDARVESPAHGRLTASPVSVLPDDFEGAVLAVILDIPRGVAVSYGWVAEEAGRPRAARAVGRVLAMTGETVPWWRVVRADGRLVAPWADEQAAKLSAEGVDVRDGRVHGVVLGASHR
jgi:methylated-DNA-protein-cysteine methyltransferase related protein